MAGQFPQTQPQYAPPKMPANSGGGATTVIIIFVVIAAVIVLTVVGCIIFGIISALLLPAVSAGHDAARTTQSRNHLKQIGLGIHNYHDAYQKLPRAAMPDDKGVPRQSWRTAILPFMEQVRIYEQMDQGKGWNEAPNAQFNNEPIPVYHSPLDGDSPPSDTSYVAIVGANAAFDPDRQLALRDMVNGTSNVVAVIEIKNSGIGWMEPRDISAEEAFQYITASERPVNVLMMDGSVQPLEKNIAPDELRKLLSRDSRRGAR